LVSISEAEKCNHSDSAPRMMAGGMKARGGNNRGSGALPKFLCERPLKDGI